MFIDVGRHAVDLAACRDRGIAMFAGEAEGRFDAVLRDAAAGQLATTYDFLNDYTGCWVRRSSH
jgi:hypothetical protein